MNKQSLLIFWNKARKYLTNKYLIVCSVFAVLFTFCGNQSIVQRIKNAHEISAKEAKLREYEQKIVDTERDLQMFSNPDSLERYAREHYHMHADGEVVYIIKD